MTCARRTPSLGRVTKASARPAQDEGRATDGRGGRRREQLLGAGIELLGEAGWAGLTARAVAQKADTHAGLLHYHFGALPQYKREVAAAAVRQLAAPALALLTASPDWATGIASVVRASAEQTDIAAARVSAELITASLHDPGVAELMRGALAEARQELVPWLSRTGATDPKGLAVLVIATLDGLLLHRLVDPALPLGGAADAAAALAPAKRTRRAPVPDTGRRARPAPAGG